MGLKLQKIMFLFAAAFVLISPEHAHATTIGDVLNSVATDTSSLARILLSICYIAGLILAVAAMFKFKDHVDYPDRTPLSDGVKRIIAGGMFLAFPAVLDALQQSLATGASFTSSGVGGSTVATPTSLDEVAVNFIADLYGPFTNAMTIFLYLMGIGFVLIGISRLTKTMQEGPRGPAGMGTLMTFISGGAMLNFAPMLGSFTTTMFGDESAETLVTLTGPLTTALSAAEQLRLQSTIEAMTLFVMLVGYVAFIRGWLVLKAYADGSQSATLAQGLTFLIGGTIAANIGTVVNVIQDTLGYTAFGFVFS